MSIATVEVNGMTCAHCTNAVTEELTAIEGVQEVSIDLVAGGTSTVTVHSSAPLDPNAIAEAIDEAGYTVAGNGDLPLA